MELRHLRYFVVVAEEGHVTRAAARLGMQQPPLSVQIKALETEFGVPLFKRHARGVELTAGGQVLLEAARAMLATVERTKERVVRAAKGIEGNVCIGCSGSVAAHSFASDVIRVYRRAYAHVALELRESNAGELTEKTARGEIDVTMMRIPVAKPPGVLFEQLFDEEMVLALPKDHRLLRGRGAEPRIALRELATEPFIFNRRPGALGMFANLERACERVGFKPRVAAEVDHMGSVINLVAAEVGISVVPASVRGVHGDSVVYCRIADARSLNLNAPVTLAYLDSNHNPAAINFIAIARKRASAYKRRLGR